MNKIQTFFENYFVKSCDKTSKQKIGPYLGRIGVKPIKVNQGDKQYYKYSISAQELKDAYDAKSWIDSNVDYYDNDDNEDNEAFDRGVNKEDKQLNINMFMKNELEALKEEIKSMKDKTSFTDKIAEQMKTVLSLKIEENKPKKKIQKKQSFSSFDAIIDFD